MNPIIDVTPFSSKDERMVVAFFKYNCTVCRNYQYQLDYWGRSLPKEFKFQQIPIFEGGELGEVSALSSVMFWTAQRSGTQDQRTAFNEAGYRIHQEFQNPKDIKAWVDAAMEVGINKEKFIAAFDIEKEAWVKYTARQKHYAPTVTPSLVICGKWMVSPESTNGDQELFMQLANGLVSKCMIEKGIKFQK